MKYRSERKPPEKELHHRLKRDRSESHLPRHMHEQIERGVRPEGVDRERKRPKGGGREDRRKGKGRKVKSRGSEAGGSERE